MIAIESVLLCTPVFSLSTSPFTVFNVVFISPSAFFARKISRLNSLEVVFAFPSISSSFALALDISPARSFVKVFSAFFALEVSVAMVLLSAVTFTSISDFVYTSSEFALPDKTELIAVIASLSLVNFSAISPKVSNASGAVPITPSIRESTSAFVAYCFKVFVYSFVTLVLTFPTSSSV